MTVTGMAVKSKKIRKGGPKEVAERREAQGLAGFYHHGLVSSKTPRKRMNPESGKTG